MFCPWVAALVILALVAFAIGFAGYVLAFRQHHRHAAEIERRQAELRHRVSCGCCQPLCSRPRAMCPSRKCPKCYPR